MEHENGQPAEGEDAAIEARFIEIEAREATAELPAGHYIAGLEGLDAEGHPLLNGPYESAKLARQALLNIIASRVIASIGILDAGDGTEAQFIDEDEPLPADIEADWDAIDELEGEDDADMEDAG